MRVSKVGIFPFEAKKKKKVGSFCRIVLEGGARFEDDEIIYYRELKFNLAYSVYPVSERFFPSCKYGGKKMCVL